MFVLKILLVALLLAASQFTFLYFLKRGLLKTHAAARLNLTGDTAMFVDQKLPLSIAPTDSSYPPRAAAVTSVVWRVTDSFGNLVEGASINTTTEDLLNAELTSDVAGDLFVAVTARNAIGDELAESMAVTVEARLVVATKLNLVAGEPVSRG